MRPLRADIRLDRLRENYQTLKRLHGGKMLAVLKADAYGHGAVRCAHALADLADEMAAMGRRASRPILLPDFDEFILGYQDRLFALTEADHRKLVPGNNGFFRRSAVANGRVVGSWQRKGAPGRRNLELNCFTDLSDRVVTGFEKAFTSWPFLTD